MADLQRDAKKGFMYRQLFTWLAQELDHDRSWFFAFELRERVVAIMLRVENDDLCHDDCKGMYFCTLPKGHEGAHSEEGRLTW